MAKIQRSSGDLDPFVAAIDARVAALQQLRASYLAAKAAGAIGQSGDALLPVTHAALDAPAAAPAQQSSRRGRISTEVERLLHEAARPMKVRHIAAALRSRGAVSAAANVEPTINSILSRLKHRGRAVRTKDGWLADSATTAAADIATTATPAAASTSTPPVLHATKPPGAISPEPVVVRVPPRRTRRPPTPRRAPGEPTPDQRPDGLAWRIESLLRSHGKPVAARYVAEATGEPLNVVGLALGRMVRQQRVEKQADGHFAVVVPLAEEIPLGGAPVK